MLRRRELILIRRAKRGDAAAIEALIRAHEQSLFRYMLKITGNPESAQDISQDAFVRVLGSIERFDEQFRFSTWLFTIAKRLWINHCQKMKPVFDTEVVGGTHDDSVAPDCQVMNESRDRLSKEAVAVGMASLSPRQYEIVRLFYGCECSIHEIAERENLPVGTVKSHLFRARQKMARVITQADFSLRESVGCSDE